MLLEKGLALDLENYEYISLTGLMGHRVQN